MRTVILLLSMLLAGCRSADRIPSAPAVATVQSTQGKTEIRRSGGDWGTVQAGDPLVAGDELRTSPSAEMNLNLGKEAGILTLHPNSILRIDSLTPLSPDGPPVTLTLTAGRITGDTLRAAGRTKVLVHTGKGSVKVP